MISIYRISRLDDPGYEENIAFIIAARNEEELREKAVSLAGDEGKDVWRIRKKHRIQKLGNYTGKAKVPALLARESTGA